MPSTHQTIAVINGIPVATRPGKVYLADHDDRDPGLRPAEARALALALLDAADHAEDEP